MTMATSSNNNNVDEQEFLQTLELYRELLAIGDGIKQLKLEKPFAYKKKVRLCQLCHLLDI